MVVYVVTDGCYSYYHIKAVFTNKKQARLYCATHESEDICIEEFDTKYNEIIAKKPVLKCWYVPISESGPYFPRLRYQYTLHKRKGVNKFSGLYLTLPESKTEEEARKAIYDYYAQWKAERQGL